MKDIFFNVHLLHFFDWLVETTIMASILTVFILIVKITLRNTLTPRWHYLLWLILIVRLLLPWSPDSSYSIYSILSNGYETMISTQSQPIQLLDNEGIDETIIISI